MKKIVLISSILLSFLFITSCDTVSNNNPNNDNKNSDLSETTNSTSFSIVRKWYTNENDDRYYYDFLSDGTLIWHYYQNIGPATSTLNCFVSKQGIWSYLNDEHTKICIVWKDSVAHYYDIVKETSEKLILQSDASGSVGFGLSTTELLKTALKVTYSIPNEIKELIGTWYYDETKDGKYIQFQEDGICYIHYYQYIGSGEFSSLNGYVTKKGVWDYNETTKILSITISGEISYYYEISELNSKMSA